jgi:hypothetical protein
MPVAQLLVAPESPASPASSGLTKPAAPALAAFSSRIFFTKLASACAMYFALSIAAAQTSVAFLQQTATVPESCLADHF